MKIAICLLTNEPEYLHEWLDHHRNYGFDNFIIYCDGFKPENLGDDVVVEKVNPTRSVLFQNKVYEDCCKKYRTFDYILIIDSDEFYHSVTGNVYKDISNIKDKYGDFDGLGLSWRMYGQPKPYFEDRQPVENYIYYYEDRHIKSMVNPKKVLKFPDPHSAKIFGKYVDELGNPVSGPWNVHTSKNVWIKHTWTRSRSEWNTKVSRKGWYENYKRKLEEFDEYNDKCIIKDATHTDTTI